MTRFHSKYACKAVLVAVLFSAPLYADSTIEFNITETSLQDALMAFSGQANIVVTMPPELVQGKSVVELKGSMSAESALQKLLNNSGLKYVTNESGGVTIVSESVSKTDTGTRAKAKAGNKRSLQIDEIVITATKRSESVQDVPISVTAIGENEIKNTHSQSLQDLAGAIPNFNFASSGEGSAQTDISIRGVYQQVHTEMIGTEPGYSVYVDGVFVGRPMAVNADLGGIERVEVLRGPQGTLFGKNTIAGAINITTKKPGNELEGSLEVEGGNMGYTALRGSINVPIIQDELAARLSVGKRDRDGHVKNLFNGDEYGDIDELSGRLTIAYTPSEATRVYLSVDGFDADSTAAPFQFLDNTVAVGGLDITVSEGPHSLSYNHPRKDALSDLGVALTVEHDFGNYTFTSITSTRDSEITFHRDFDKLPQERQETDSTLSQRVIAQEFRISSPTDTWYDYVAGLYYLKQDNGMDYKSYLGPDWFGPPFVGTALTDASIGIVSYAVFVHTNFHITDRSTLFAGFRYTDETKEWYHFQTGEGFGVSNEDAYTAFNAPLGEVVAPDLEAAELSWTLGLRHHLSDDLMLYGSVSTGFKSGAYSTSNFVPYPILAAGLTVEPEFVTNYEIGAKSTWLDGGLRLNAALFYLDYEDLQVQSFNPTAGPNNTGLSLLQNAGEVTSKGFELEIAAQLSQGLSFTTGIGYVDATFAELPGIADPRGGPNLDATGNRVPRSPKWTANTALNHEWLLENGARWLARLDYSYQDESYSSNGLANLPDDKLPGYSVVNARLGYEAADDSWGVYLWAKNLLDEEKLVSKRYVSGHTDAVQVIGRYMEPRTYGLTLNYSF